MCFRCLIFSLSGPCDFYFYFVLLPLGLHDPFMFVIFRHTKHKQNIWKEHLDAHWDHRQITHILWKTIHGLSNRAPPPTLNTSLTFSNHTQTHCELFYQTIQKHTTHKTKRYTNRATHKIQGYNTHHNSGPRDSKTK